MKAEKPWQKPRGPVTQEHSNSKPWQKKGPFALHAAELLLNGYSAVPISPGSKRPPDEKWNVLRSVAYRPDAVELEARLRPNLGLGVAGGYGGLVPIDIDTEDEEIVAAVCSVLPRPNVAKRGRKGYTAFYRAPDGWTPSGKKFKPSAVLPPMVEVLGTGQSVLPPTLHPDTGKPYEWLTPDTLFTIRIEDLPQLDADFMEALEAALAPWMERAPEAPKTPASPPTEISDKRIRAYALDVLTRRANELASMCGESGRNNALLAAAARCGSWVHHGVISESELRSALRGAYEACGGIKDHGSKQFEATVRNGLKASAGDELRRPESDDREHAVDGVDISGLIASAEAKQVAADEKVVPFTVVPGAPKQELKLIQLADLRLNTAANYLIKGVLPARGFGVVWGPPKNGKSFYVADLALHIAMGKTYRDLRVKGGPVVYCILEGSDGFNKRMEALKQQLVAEGVDLAEIPFYVMAARLELVKDRDALVAAIRTQLGRNPALVVIDTLNRSFTGSESSDEEMTAYVKAADAVTAMLECLTLVVHHCGHDHTRMRGHSSLLGAVDVEISVRREEKTGPICARVEMMKDGPDGAEFVSNLKEVEVGIDDDGDPITTCVVEPDVMPEKPQKSGPKEGRDKLTDKALIAFRALEEAIKTEGHEVEHQEGIPPNVRCVQIGVWRAFARRRGISDGESDGAFRKAFGRLTEGLQVKGYVGVLDSWRWIEPNPNDLEFLGQQIATRMMNKNKLKVENGNE